MPYVVSLQITVVENGTFKKRFARRFNHPLRNLNHLGHTIGRVLQRTIVVRRRRGRPPVVELRPSTATSIPGRRRSPAIVNEQFFQ
jgi:hypothetical protein